MGADENLVSPGPPMSKTKSKSGIVVPHSSKWYQRLAARILWAVINVVSATLRYRLHDENEFMIRKDLRNVIYGVWHNRLALSMKLNSIFGARHHQPAGLAALVSASKDGAFLSAVLECFRVQPARGSSSRRGSQALLELTTWAERGYDIAITPDGPRGPCYIVQEGVMSLAQVTGLPIVPVAYHLQWKIRLNSWDRFQIPLPFSRVDIYLGRLITVPRDISGQEREELRQQLEGELKRITKD